LGCGHTFREVSIKIIILTKTIGIQPVGLDLPKRKAAFVRNQTVCKSVKISARKEY
jgi:hypothetical protein